MRGAGQQAVMLALMGMLMACSSGSDSPLYRPSGAPAWIPPPHTPFSDYIRQNEDRIRQALVTYHYASLTEPFGPGYPLERAVAMRAPYELGNAAAQCPQGPERRGFLLIHGLTDSPYLLRGVAESLQQAFPCALLRGVLLPGHGTVPGDSLEMRHEDWLRVTEYGVESFRGEVDSLHLVGFSTGTALSLRYAAEHREDALLRGLIMLSPALAARSESAWLSPWARWFTPWLGRDTERDAARYESFSMNAGAEFYLLTRGLTAPQFPALTLPVFMAGSGDDTTVDMEAAREFFCSKTPEQSRRMLWYSAQATGSVPAASCEGLQVVASESPAHRVYSLSHTAISVPPTDPHYGLDGDFALCGHFRDADYETCRYDASATVYGERNLGEGGRYKDRLVRRGSFNPHYDAMLAEMVCFIQADC